MNNIVERVVREEQPKLVKKIKNYIYDPGMVIGSGFSSNVFKGHNEANGETIAIKVLQLSKIQSEVEKYLLNNEINALRALTHPHVLRTVEILMTKNNVYIMTEFCQNGDLQQLIKQKGKLTEIEGLRLIRDVVDGYTAIEEKNIVHRDLKTANIFLTGSGARIADFGFCQFLNQTKKPQLFYNVGSPAYMSPQSYRENSYSAKSDIWSIGIILFETLLGETPDKNLSYLEMSSNLMSGKISSGSNEQIRKILAGCFKKDTKERYSPKQLLDAIDKEITRLESKAVFAVQPNNPRNYKSVSPHSNIVPNSPALINYRHSRPVPLVGISPIQQEQKPRGHSPFQTRFGTTITRQGEASPLRSGEKRFLREDQGRSKEGAPALRIRNLTEMLVFLLRQINYIGDTNLECSSFMRLILFRHRSYLESLVEKIAADERLDRNINDPLKNFHYLKSKFDDSYLQKQSQSTSHSSPPQVQTRLNELSNQSFNDPRSLAVYCGLSLDAGRECERAFVNGGIDAQELNKIGVAWDYLLIQLQIMALYALGLNVDVILQEYIPLATILKEQPKRLTNTHFQLLKVKQKLIAEQCEKWVSEVAEKRGSDQPQTYYQMPDKTSNNAFF